MDFDAKMSKNHIKLHQNCEKSIHFLQNPDSGSTRNHPDIRVRIGVGKPDLTQNVTNKRFSEQKKTLFYV